MSGLPSQALRYYAPRPALGPYLTNLFAWTGERTAFESWMPAIESQVFIRLGGFVAIRFDGGLPILVDRPMLVGPMGGTMHIRTTDDLTAVGAGLTTRGYRLLIGAPATPLTDSATDLGALIGSRAVTGLVARLGDELGHEARVRLFEAWLAARIAAGVACDRRAAAIDDWIAGPEPATIAGLHDRLGVSGRQATRIAAGLTGLGPKSLAMRQRALRAAQRIATEGGATAVVNAIGYADQSHMIRDFGRFIGVTPAQLARVAIQRHVFADPERAGTALAHGQRT